MVSSFVGNPVYLGYLKVLVMQGGVVMGVQDSTLLLNLTVQTVQAHG